jgi:cytochrome c553
MTAIRVGTVLLLAALLAAPALAEGDTARGEKLFALCATCHTESGGGNELTLAPAIAGLPEWYVKAQLEKFRASGRGAHFDDIGGLRMRPMARWLGSEGDVEAVAAYVASLPATYPKPTLEGGDAEKGKLYFAPCIACHGPQGTGMEALKAPPIAQMSDWYLLTSLKNFKAGVRGTNPLDTSGALMRPMTMTLPDEQAMLDVIAYIKTLAKQ